MKYLESQKIKKALVLIHNKGLYYQGMNILCKLIDWPPIGHKTKGYFDETNEEAISELRDNVLAGR